MFSEDADSTINLVEIQSNGTTLVMWILGVSKKKNNSHVVDEKYFFMGPCIPSKILKRGYMAEDDLNFCQVFIIKQKLNFSTLKS